MAEKTLDPKFYKPKNQPVVGEQYLELIYDESTLKTELKLYTIVGGVRGPGSTIYTDGAWSNVPGTITTQSEKVEVHEKVKEYLKTKVSGNKPAFVIQNAGSTDVGFGTTAVPSQSSGLIPSFDELISGPLLNADEIFGTDMKKIFPYLLKYPIDIIDDQQDILKITQYEYQAPYKDIFNSGSLDTKKIFEQGLGVQRGSALKSKIQSVILPIPNGISDSNGVNWGEDSMSTQTMAAAGKIGSVITSIAASKGAEALAKIAGYDQLSNVLGAPQVAQLLSLYSMTALRNPSTKSAVRAEILKRAGFNVSPESLLARGFGVVANSNMELLFSGPILRGFQFSYAMSPRSEGEAKMCRKIIRFFKQGMAVKKSQKIEGFGASSFLLATPNVFKLEYKTFEGTGQAKNIEGLNRFKICALTNFTVNYADGQWAAFEGGQPVKYVVTMSFKELEPVYENDYQVKSYDEPNYKTRVEPETNDQSPVGENDIGY